MAERNFTVEKYVTVVDFFVKYGGISMQKTLEQLKDHQLQDFNQLRDNLLLFFERLTPEDLEKTASHMLKVFEACDEIDYAEEETAWAYAIVHLLDRYHRFQIMQRYLCEKGLLKFRRDRFVNILDIGTGPAPALLAFSSFFHTLNLIGGENRYQCKGDYVEQSVGFKSFLHHFVEISQNVYADGVPYHHGSFDNFEGISFEKDLQTWKWTKRFKYRFDLAILSNFLTTTETVNKFREELKNLRRVMRNNSLIMVVGASDEQSLKYTEVYKTCDEVIVGKFRNWKYTGFWKKIIQEEFTYDYTDEYGEIMREFYQQIVDMFCNADIWDKVPEKARKKLSDRIENTKEKTEKESWTGVHWRLVVYRKKAWLTKKEPSFTK